MVTTAWQQSGLGQPQSLLQQLAQQNLTGQQFSVAGVPQMDPNLLAAWTNRMGQLQQQYPSTIAGAQGFEPTMSEGAMSHFRTMGGITNDYMLGVNPSYDDPWSLNRVAGRMQNSGFTVPSAGERPLQQVIDHEMGHAVDNNLRNYLLNAQAPADLRLAGAGAYTDLKAQLVADALNGRISDYAQQSAFQRLGFPATNVSDLSTGAAVRGQFGAQQINHAAKESFAEAFARNPESIAPAEDVARMAGWTGAASLPTLGFGAALLAAPLIAHKVGGSWGRAINGAAMGGGIGSMLGPEGGIAGAGIGALASQFLR